MGEENESGGQGKGKVREKNNPEALVNKLPSIAYSIHIPLQ